MSLLTPFGHGHDVRLESANRAKADIDSPLPFSRDLSGPKPKNPRSIASDDLALAAVHGRRGGRPAGLSSQQDRGPAPLDGCAPPPSRRGRTARQCGRSGGTARAALPSLSSTSSGTPSTRAQHFHCAIASSPSVATNSGTLRPLSRCSSMTATAAGSSPSGGSSPHADAAEFVHRHADFHADAAHRAPQHHALAIELDVANLPVGAAVARRIAHRQGVGVEPQRAARPGGPVDSHDDASKLSQPGLCARSWRDHAAEPSESA